MQAGAINMVNTSSLTLLQTTFSGNNGSQGGAIGMAKGSRLWAGYSDFISNLAENGGALYMLQCAAVQHADMCTMLSQTPTTTKPSCSCTSAISRPCPLLRNDLWTMVHGCAPIYRSEGADFEECDFEGNMAKTTAGAIYQESTPGSIMTSTFTSNGALVGFLVTMQSMH